MIQPTTDAKPAAADLMDDLLAIVDEPRTDAPRPASTKRDDIHRPSEIVPDEYEYLFSYSYAGGLGDPAWNTALLTATKTGKPAPEPIWGIVRGRLAITGTRMVESPWGKLDYFHKANGKGGCDVCGAHYRHGDVWRHKPTGECIELGHICAAKYELLTDRREWTAAKKVRDKRKASVILAAKKTAAVFAWARANRELLPALRLDHKITKDIRARLISTGAKWGLSEKQTALVKKLYRESLQPKKPEAPKVDAPEGRQVIRGKIVTAKVKDGYYGPQLKCLIVVDTPAGEWKTWGTVPAAIERAADAGDHDLRGSIVELTATVKRSDDDRSFSFYSRPSKASIITPAS